MENKEGYKKTELGWIPEEWDFFRLDKSGIEIIDGDRGVNYPKQDEFFHNGFCLFLNAKNVTKAGFKFDETQYISKSKDELLSKGKLQRDDIVITTRGTVGNIAWFNNDIQFNEIRINSGMALIRQHKRNYDSLYLYNFLRSDVFQKQVKLISFGSAQPQLTIKEIKLFNIITPPLPEQQKIASILTTVDDKISSIEAQIQQTEQLKKGLMAKLLTEGIGHTEFKDTEIGRIPESWEVTELSNIIKTTQLGINIQASTSKIGIPLLKMGNLTIGGFNFSKIEKISDTDISPYTDFILKKGDFLFNTRNSPELVGKSAVWKSDELMLFNSNILRIIFLENTNSFFIAYFFASDIGWKKLKQISKNTTSVGAIYSKDLLKIKIAIPPLQEQQQIASILSSVDDKLDVLQSKKTSYSTLKKGLMAKLLTGQMRVKIS